MSARASSIAILTYHSLDASGSVLSVAPSDFANQMSWLADLGFRGISLRDAIAHWKASASWPANCAVLTFDDGYANFLSSGLSVLNQNSFTATMFVISGHMGGRNDWALPPTGLGTQAILSWQQAAELSAAGIEIGAHTKTHPRLSRLSAAAIEKEIVTSKAEIEGHLGQPVSSFAYPFGHADAAAFGIAQREFQAACTTELRRARGELLHRLPRIDMYYIRKRRAFEALLSGQLDRYLTVRRWARAVRRVFPQDRQVIA